MQVLDSLTAAGTAAKGNEDIWGHGPAMAWIFDGATGLAEEPLVGCDGESDARWLVARADAYLRTQADKAWEMRQLYENLLSACAADFRAQARRSPRAAWEMPMAASLVIQYDGSRLVCGALSDCTLVVETVTGGIGVMPPCPKHAALDAVSHEKMRAAVAGGLSPAEARASIKAHLQDTRKRANRADGYDVFAPDPAVAARVRVAAFAPKPGGYALMMTDGFAALVDSYRAYDHRGLLAAAARRGLEPLYRHIRAIEAEDTDLQKYPRTKQSDDATAVLLRL